jgi:hypothetical protein
MRREKKNIHNHWIKLDKEIQTKSMVENIGDMTLLKA